MPGEIAGTEEIMRFLAKEVSSDTYVNVMEQYHPAIRVNGAKFDEINRRVTDNEFRAALEQAKEAGLWRFDERRSPASLLLRALTRDNCYQDPMDEPGPRSRPLSCLRAID